MPVQAAGNHQVQHRPMVALDADRDTFADAARDVTVLPCKRDGGGWVVRNKNGLAMRMASNGCPGMRVSSASMYTAISGSSGIQLRRTGKAKSNQPIIISSQLCSPQRTGEVGSGLKVLLAELSKKAVHSMRVPRGSSKGV